MTDSCVSSAKRRSRRNDAKETNGLRLIGWERKRESGGSQDGGACLSTCGGKIDRLGRRSWREGKKLLGEETAKRNMIKFP